MCQVKADIMKSVAFHFLHIFPNFDISLETWKDNPYTKVVVVQGKAKGSILPQFSNPHVPIDTAISSDHATLSSTPEVMQVPDELNVDCQGYSPCGCISPSNALDHFFYPQEVLEGPMGRGKNTEGFIPQVICGLIFKGWEGVLVWVTGRR